MPEGRKEESNCNADRSFVTPAPFTHCSALLHIILCANGSDDADSCDHTQSTHEQGRARQANEEVWRDLQVGGGGPRLREPEGAKDASGRKGDGVLQ